MCAVGVGIFVPSALDAFSVETATIGVETGIPMPKEARIEIGVGNSYWRRKVCYQHRNSPVSIETTAFVVEISVETCHWW